MLKDRKLVSREEAQRRIDICKECPLAGDVRGCWGCYAIFRQIRRLLKNSPVELPEGKRFCLACGCHLSKVWIPNETLDRAEMGNKPDYANMCWRREKQDSA